MADAGFWDDQERAREVIGEVKVLRAWVEPYDALSARARDAGELNEMLALEPDESMSRELEQDTLRLEEEVQRFELQSLLRGADDV